MKRLPNWRTDFFAAIAAHRQHHFAWGSHDCALLSADCVKAVIGTDLAAEFRGAYDSEASSAEELAARGYANTEAILADRFSEIPPGLAIVGDIAVIYPPRKKTVLLAPVVGSEVAVFSLRGPLGLRPLSDAVRAYRIEIRGD